MKQIILISLLLLLQSCLTYKEKIIINNDESGIIEFQFQFGKFISYLTSFEDEDDLGDEFKIDLGNSENLTLVDQTEKMVNGKRTFFIAIEFKHVNDLQDLRYVSGKSESKRKKSDFAFGEFFEDISIRNGQYKRIIDLGNHNSDNQDPPEFIKNMVDLSFEFSVEYNGKENEWFFDIDDLSGADELVMTIDDSE